jgi:hypothetical protein
MKSVKSVIFYLYYFFLTRALFAIRNQEAGEGFVNNRDTESLTSLTSLIGVAIGGHRAQRDAAVPRRALSAGHRFFQRKRACGRQGPARALASGQKLGFAPGARRPSKHAENIEKQDISPRFGVRTGGEPWCAGSRSQSAHARRVDAVARGALSRGQPSSLELCLQVEMRPSNDPLGICAMRSRTQAEQIAQIAESTAAFVFTNQPNRLPQPLWAFARIETG